MRDQVAMVEPQARVCDPVHRGEINVQVRHRDAEADMRGGIVVNGDVVHATIRSEKQRLIGRNLAAVHGVEKRESTDSKRT